MVHPVDELKTRAELLHKRIASGEATARARLRALPGFGEPEADVQRKHCLAVVAREHGFSTWEHARRVLRGEADELDFGTLLYDKASGGTLNAWFASYDEARAHLDEVRRAGRERYLLAYRRQFFVVDSYFIESLGLDPHDADWAGICFDWARPGDLLARQRLYRRRIDALRKE